jgi:hypothetical protein
MKTVTFHRTEAEVFGKFIAALERGNVSYSIHENSAMVVGGGWTVTIIGAKI